MKDEPHAGRVPLPHSVAFSIQIVCFFLIPHLLAADFGLLQVSASQGNSLNVGERTSARHRAGSGRDLWGIVDAQ